MTLEGQVDRRCSLAVSDRAVIQGWAGPTLREATMWRRRRGGGLHDFPLLRVGVLIGQIPGDIDHRDPLAALE